MMFSEASTTWDLPSCASLCFLIDSRSFLTAFGDLINTIYIVVFAFLCLLRLSVSEELIIESKFENLGIHFIFTFLDLIWE